MTNKMKWARQLVHIVGAPERNIEGLSEFQVTEQMHWLKLMHGLKAWPINNERLVYADWSDFELHEDHITELKRDKSGVIIDIVSHSLEEGWERIEYFANISKEPGIGNVEITSNQN